MTPSKKQTRTPVLGEWALKATLGRRREYVLYHAQHISTGEAAHLRVLNSNASAADRKRFQAEVDIVSKHQDHFVSVHSLRSHGEVLVAVSEIPRQLLDGCSFSPDIAAITSICLQLSEALHLLHEAGWVHGALGREAVEVANAQEAQVRLTSMGMALELGHTYAATSQAHFPPEVTGIAAAAVEWDIYALGLLGLQLIDAVDANRTSRDAVSVALREIFTACSSELPENRPYALSIVQRRLRDISRLPKVGSRESSRSRAPHLNSRAARLSAAETSWFVEDCLTNEQSFEIEGYQTKSVSPLARTLGSWLSLTTGTALAFVLATIFGLEAFGY